MNWCRFPDERNSEDKAHNKLMNEFSQKRIRKIWDGIVKNKSKRKETLYCFSSVLFAQEYSESRAKGQILSESNEKYPRPPASVDFISSGKLTCWEFLECFLDQSFASFFQRIFFCFNVHIFYVACFSLAKRIISLVFATDSSLHP